jgi:hypothetical protein
MDSRIVTSGLAALDQVLQGLRLGDNIVWQVDRLDDYRHFAEPFARQVIRDGRAVRPGGGRSAEPARGLLPGVKRGKNYDRIL